MISESEFVMIKAFDRMLGKSVDQAQRLVNAKNVALVRMQAAVRARDAEIQALRGALVAERAKTTALAAHLQRFMGMH